ncbi:Gfo/Idh/MocA family oxidoreductase [Acidobacteria bacterium AH-259-O06]|nr:Gfo/Idh/MocA family oxidoreductase [Acidobacteria bacterium AH-259-O06]
MKGFYKRGNRRDFIRQSAAIAGAAPAMIGLGGTSFGQSGNSDILCGMIGTGNRGRTILERIIKLQGVRVAALCDIQPEALDKGRSIVAGHKPQTYWYYRDLLEQQDLDAVFVVTPPYLHKPMVIDVLQSGRHCYAEKPIALTVNEIEEVGKEAKKAKGILQVGQQLRYRPQYRKAMEMIHRGEIGEVGFVRAQRYANWNGKPREGKMRWLYSIEESGDQIVEQSVHELDVLNWVMNDHPVRIAGLGGQNMLFEPKGNQIMDHYGLTLEYPGNRHAIFSMLKYAVREMGGTFIHAYGSKAVFDVSYRGPAKIVWREGQGTSEPTTLDVEDVDMTLESVSDFFRCIRENEQPFCNIEVASSAALTALLGRKAMYERRVVTWRELLKEGAPVRPRRG